jgi:hypothetical protein
MKWQIDDHGRLIISVTRLEQRSLQAAQRRDEKGRCDPPFESDAFMHDLLEAMTTNDEYVWLPEGCTDDLTSAPMLGILGEEMPGPDDTADATGMGLVHVGRWNHEGRLRQMYQPVLKRWAYMSYAVTSPQRELAESGVCTWDGGDLWGTQDAAVKALAKFMGQEIESQA